MNDQMKLLCTNLLLTLKTFEIHIEAAALKDDGRIDRQESKEIQKLTKEVRKLEKEIDKLI